MNKSSPSNAIPSPGALVPRPNGGPPLFWPGGAKVVSPDKDDAATLFRPDGVTAICPNGSTATSSAGATIIKFGVNDNVLLSCPDGPVVFISGATTASVTVATRTSGGEDGGSVVSMGGVHDGSVITTDDDAVDPTVDKTASGCSLDGDSKLETPPPDGTSHYSKTNKKKKAARETTLRRINFL